MLTLKQVLLKIDYIKSCGIEIKFHGRARGEPSHYCGPCDVEVFNILLVKEHEKKHVVHCLDCARKINSHLEGFVCLEEYKLKDLCETYDNYTMHQVRGIKVYLKLTFYVKIIP